MSGDERSGSPPRRGLLSGLFAPPEFYAERDRNVGPVPPTRFESVFEPAALVAAIVLFASGTIQFGLAVAPGWRVEGLLPLVALVAVVGYFYSRRLARGVVLLREWIVLLAPALLLTRFMPYLGTDAGSLLGDVAHWTREPFAFFEGGFVARAVLLLGAWWTAFASAQDLGDLRVQRGELTEAPARTVIERAWESDRIRSIDHTGPLRRLAARFLQGGVLLVLLAALTAASVRQLLSIEAVAELVTFGRPSSSVALVNVVAYFVVVLLLLVEAQYVRSRALWALDGVQVAPGMASRWGAAGVLLVVAGLVAALLAPTEGLLGVGEVVRLGVSLLGLIGAYAAVGVYVLLWLVTYPLRWLFGTGGEESAGTAPFAPPQISPAPEGGSLLDVLKSALFWMLLLGIVGYSLVVLWRQGALQRYLPGVANLLARIGASVVSMIAALLRFIRGAGAHAAAVARALVPRRVSLAPSAGRGWLDGLLPGRDPRRIVIAMYTLMLTRAGQSGLERRVGQTASEYRAQLGAGVPAAGAEVDALTEQFLLARYSPHRIEPEQARLARRCWDVIRRRLRPRLPGR